MKIIKTEIKAAGLKMEVDKQEFALTLKTWRLRHGYLQREVAQMFGVSRYTIIKAENAQDITWMMAYRIFAQLSKRLEEEAKE